MAELAMGWREGPGKGKEYPVAASQYFHRRGGHFVYVDSSGNVTLCRGYDAGDGAGTRRVFGWAEVPKDAAGKNSWKSSTTAAADKVFVITGLDNRFEVPLSVVPTATTLGKYGRVATYTTATYATRQRIQPTLTATLAEFIIYDVDISASTALVGVNPLAVMSQ